MLGGHTHTHTHTQKHVPEGVIVQRERERECHSNEPLNKIIKKKRKEKKKRQKKKKKDERLDWSVRTVNLGRSPGVIHWVRVGLNDSYWVKTEDIGFNWATLGYTGLE